MGTNGQRSYLFQSQLYVFLAFAMRFLKPNSFTGLKIRRIQKVGLKINPTNHAELFAHLIMFVYPRGQEKLPLFILTLIY